MKKSCLIDKIIKIKREVEASKQAAGLMDIKRNFNINR